MKGKLSIGLVVGLTVAAFLVGLTGHALLTSGGGHRQTAAGPTFTVSTPPEAGPAQSTAPPSSTAAHRRAARPRTGSTPEKASPTVVRVVSAPGRTRSVTVSVPEPNPLAGSPPQSSTTVTAPPASPATAPAPASSPTASPPTGATGESDEPVQLEPGVRQSLASEGARLLRSSAVGGEEGAGSEVLQGLEHCLELIADSSLPAGVEPAGCDLE